MCVCVRLHHMWCVGIVFMHIVHSRVSATQLMSTSLGGEVGVGGHICHLFGVNDIVDNGLAIAVA